MNFMLPEDLVKPATDAGIKVPPDLDFYQPFKYPYFSLLCTMMAGKPIIDEQASVRNARIIASIPVEDLPTITPEEIWEMGWVE